MDELWTLNLTKRKIEVGIGTSFSGNACLNPIIIKINSNTWPNLRALSDWPSSTNYYGQTRACERSGGIQPAGEDYELISPAVLSQ